MLAHVMGLARGTVGGCRITGFQASLSTSETLSTNKQQAKKASFQTVFSVDVFLHTKIQF